MLKIKLLLSTVLLVVSGVTTAQEGGETIGAFTYFEQIDPFSDVDTSFIATFETGAESSLLSYRCGEFGFESLVTTSYLGSDGTAPVEFRFDKKEPSGSKTWSLSTNGTAVFVPDSALSAWVAESRSSSTLATRMTDFNGSTETHTFSLEGFEEAISRLACVEGL